MDEKPVEAVAAAGDERLLELVEGNLDVLGAEAADVGELGLGRRLGHDGRAGNAGVPGNPRQPLGHITGADGPNAGGQLVTGALTDGIGRAT